MQATIESGEEKFRVITFRSGRITAYVRDSMAVDTVIVGGGVAWTARGWHKDACGEVLRSRRRRRSPHELAGGAFPSGRDRTTESKTPYSGPVSGFRFVLLLLGFPENSWYLRAQLQKPLADAGYHVVRWPDIARAMARETAVRKSEALQTRVEVVQ